jgi:glycosyltransferase involved in cell wall biosynthesis
MFGSVYDNIDLLLITSFYEGGPACVPEAYACGVPIVSSPVGMSLDFVRHNQNGYILSMNPYEDFLFFNEYFSNGDLQEKFRQEALNTREKLLTWQDNVKCYQNIYTQIAQSCGQVKELSTQGGHDVSI